jgi:hypothetical protein
MKKLLPLILLALICGGCSSKMAVVELVYKDRTVLTHAHSDYTCAIYWYPEKAPSFYLYNRPAGTRIKTTEWETFVKELKRLPDGAEMDRISKCQASLAGGMPDAKSDEFNSLLAAKKMTLVNGDIMLCTCESKSFRFLYDKEL